MSAAIGLAGPSGLVRETATQLGFNNLRQPLRERLEGRLRKLIEGGIVAHDGAGLIRSA